MKRSRNAGNANKRKKVATSVVEHGNISLESAINFLLSGNSKSPRLEQFLKHIENVSHKEGLSPEAITELLDVVVTNEKFKLPIRRRLIYCLIPSDNIPEDAVGKAASCITNPVSPEVIKLELVKWLCAAFPYLATSLLTCLYPVLFVLLQRDLMRSHVCELLYNLTKAEHVTPYRIRYLVGLQSRVGSQACVLALLQLYMSYRPDLVICYCKYKKCFKSLGRFPSYIAQVKQTQTVSVQRGPSEQSEQLIIKKEITTFAHLSEAIYSLKGNVGIVKLLKSPMRRVLLTSGLPETFMIRLKLFLQVALFTETTWSSSFLHGYPRDSILPLLSSISGELHETMPEVLAFIASYFKIWDGQKSFNLLLEILQYWEIRPFEDILESVLEPLYKQFCYSSVAFKCCIIHCLTNLYKNWVLYESPRFLGRAENLATSPTLQKQITIFERETVLFDPDEQIQALGSYVDKLCTLSFLMHPEHPPQLLYTTLRFYDMLLSVHSHSSSSPLSMPSPLTMCAWVFSTNPAILSSACGLVCRYRAEIYRMKGAAIKTAVEIERLNSYISDISNMLGLRSAFKCSDRTIFFAKKLAPNLKKVFPNAHDCFSVYHHPALYGLSIVFLALIEGQEEPPPHALLTRPGLRDAYFKHLSASGFDNVVKFLRAFVRTFGVLSEEQASFRDVL